MKEDPPPDARCRDKFLVQSALIGAAQGPSVAAIVSLIRASILKVARLKIVTKWPEIEKTSKDAIKERKIRVTFLPAHDSSSTPQHNVMNGHVGRLIDKREIHY